MKPQYLLLEDVEGLGRSGDLVTAKPGFVNNYLLPQQKALRADKRTLRMQARLQEERAKQAKIDLEESKKIALAVENIVLEIEVKVDPEGKMYGSVGPQEVSELLQAKGINVDKRFVKLHQPCKETGIHTVPLKLKEGVEAFVKLKIRAEGMSDEELAKIQAKAKKSEEKAARIEEAASVESKPSESPEKA
jgi:large subunit ribosomal protein L9